VALVGRIHARGGVALVQPYLADVDSSGETAVVFLGGTISHVVRKRAILRADEVAPAAPDGVGRELEVAHAMFDDDLVVPGDAAPDDLRFAERLLAEVSERFEAPLYLRVDLVRNAAGSPVQLELEAIDPVLYLELTPGADRTFAAAVLAS
nr:hypothetical protein [Actinomycetota bacterium]